MVHDRAADGERHREVGGRFGETHPADRRDERVVGADRHLGPTLEQGEIDRAQRDRAGICRLGQRIELRSKVFDLALGFDITEQLSLSMGVNNIFDKKPQVIGDNQEQANTYPGVYDVLGRDYFVSASLKF